MSEATRTNEQEPKGSMPLTRAVLIAILMTISSTITYYLPDTLPTYSEVVNSESGYDFFRYSIGTFVGALLALLGSSELVKRFEK